MIRQVESLTMAQLVQETLYGYSSYHLVVQPQHRPRHTYCIYVVASSSLYLDHAADSCMINHLFRQSLKLVFGL